MPFTLAHPAAVLPVMRRPLHGLALVCGAMAPDIPYYLRSTPLRVTAQSWYEPFTNATTSHSLAGLLPVTLPLALAGFLIAFAAVPPLVWFARGRWDVPSRREVDARPGRTDGVGARGAARRGWVAVSLLIGVLTHLAWDSLTSSDGILAERFDALNGAALGDLTWVRSMQHVSSVIGLTVVVVALWRRRRFLASHDAASRRRASWGFVGLAAVGSAAGTVSVLATVDASAHASTRDLVEHVLATGMVSGGAAVGLAVLAGTACWWLAMFRTRPAVPTSW